MRHNKADGKVRVTTVRILTNLYMKQSNLDLASTVWHRHLYEFSHKINQSCVCEILEAFPYNIPSPVQCNWLAKHMLSEFVKFCPNSVDLIADWANDRVKYVLSTMLSVLHFLMFL